MMHFTWHWCALLGVVVVTMGEMVEATPDGGGKPRAISLPIGTAHLSEDGPAAVPAPAPAYLLPLMGWQP